MTQRTPFTLLHPNGLQIHAALAESDALALPDVDRRDMRTGYVWYDLPVASIEGEAVGMSLCFFRGQLWGLQVAVIDARFGTGWDDWSELKERARTEATREWLERVGYPAGSYQWGEVWAVYDAKGAFGGGGVRFKGVGEPRSS